MASTSLSSSPPATNRTNKKHNNVLSCGKKLPSGSKTRQAGDLMVRYSKMPPKEYDAAGNYVDCRVHHISDDHYKTVYPKDKFEPTGVKLKIMAHPSRIRRVVDIIQVNPNGIGVDIFRCPLADCNFAARRRDHVRGHVENVHGGKAGLPDNMTWDSHPTCSWKRRKLTDAVELSDEEEWSGSEEGDGVEQSGLAPPPPLGYMPRFHQQQRQTDLDGAAERGPLPWVDKRFRPKLSEAADRNLASIGLPTDRREETLTPNTHARQSGGARSAAGPSLAFETAVNVEDIDLLTKNRPRLLPITPNWDDGGSLGYLPLRTPNNTSGDDILGSALDPAAPTQGAALTDFFGESLPPLSDSWWQINSTAAGDTHHVTDPESGLKIPVTIPAEDSWTVDIPPCLPTPLPSGIFQSVVMQSAMRLAERDGHIFFNPETDDPEVYLKIRKEFEELDADNEATAAAEASRRAPMARMSEGSGDAWLDLDDYNPNLPPHERQVDRYTFMRIETRLRRERERKRKRSR